ncbi:MAG: ABC transporter substrate-binding protein [Myxococcales bacterium]|nr:ABC transporter substrate-binding protein [Myxococcales bacterium]
MTSKIRSGILLAGVLAASGLWACSLIVTRGDTQCATDGDCAGFGAQSKCTPEKVCATPTTDGGGGACTTNKECIDREGGVPAICRKDTKVCVRLTNEDCSRVLSVTAQGELLTDRRAVENDDTIVLGSLTSLLGANQPKGEARVNAFELALQEFAARPIPIGGRTRPIAVLSCNDIDVTPPAGGADPAVVRSARHLVSSVGVPAVIGGGNSGTTTAALKEVTAKGAVLIAPSATSPALTSNPDKMGLFFRTAPSDALQAIPLIQLINEAEAAPPAGKKLLVFSKGDSYGQGLRDQLVDKLTYAGKKISDPSNTAYKGLEYKADAAFDFSPLVQQALQFEPGIIVIAGTNETVDGLVKPIEAQWPGAKPRPTYIVSDGLKADKLIDLIKADENAAPSTQLRTRVRGTAPGRPNAITDTFAIRYTSRFAQAGSGATTFGTAGAYDAAYLILWGLGTVAPDAPISGQGIVAGIRRITKTGKTAVDVGPNGIDVGKPLLASGSEFDLNGASSPLEFDEAGESPADIEVWCVQKAATTGGAPSYFTTGRYYNAQTKTVVGTYNCPTGGDGGT